MPYSSSPAHGWKIERGVKKRIILLIACHCDSELGKIKIGRLENSYSTSSCKIGRLLENIGRRVEI